jgi:hypothetical protein
MKGLPKRTLVVAEVFLEGRWISMGSVKTNKAGRALLPAFKSTKAGAFTVRLVTAMRPVSYLTIKVTSVRGNT